MFKKLNMRGVSHHFLLPVLAILFVAGIGGYVMQRSSSAAVRTGWTSIGSMTAGKKGTNAWVTYKASACKVKVLGGKYIVKVRAQKTAIGEYTNLSMTDIQKSLSNNSVGILLIKSNADGSTKQLGKTNIDKIKSTSSTTVTSQDGLTSSSKIYAWAFKYSGGQYGTRTKIVKVSSILSCK